MKNLHDCSLPNLWDVAHTLLLMKFRRLIYIMGDYYLTHREELSELSPEQLAVGLNVNSERVTLTKEGLELLENEITRREDAWIDKGGASMGSVAAFAACRSFTTNLVGITLKYAERANQTYTKSHGLSSASQVPVDVWEASLFLWINLIEPQLLGETLQSLESDVLRQFLVQLGRLLLSASTYLSQELIMEILLKMNDFYLRQSKGKNGSVDRDRLAWVNYALPQHVKSELPTSPNKQPAYGDRPPYRRWINTINTKNPLITTVPFQSLNCQFEMQSGPKKTSYVHRERGRGYLDLCPKNLYLFLSGNEEAPGGGDPDAFVRLFYDDLVKAHFECDANGNVLVIHLHMSQPAELCRFFSIDSSDAVAQLKFTIPSDSATSAALFRQNLHTQLQVEEEKIEDELTVPSARPKISRTDSRSASVAAQSASSAARPREDASSEVSTPPHTHDKRASQLQQSMGTGLHKTKDVARLHPKQTREQNQAQQLLATKRGLSERSINLQGAGLQDIKKARAVDASLDSSLLVARVPSERGEIGSMRQRQNFGFDKNLNYSQSMETGQYEVQRQQQVCGQYDDLEPPKEWYLLSPVNVVANAAASLTQVDLGFMPSTTAHAQQRPLQAAPVPGIEMDEAMESTLPPDELEVRISKLITHCVALRERDRRVAIKREQDHASARASEQMAAYLGDWKTMSFVQRVDKESSLLMRAEAAVQQLAAVTATVENELSYYEARAQELDLMRKTEVNGALRSVSEDVKVLEQSIAREDEQFHASLQRRTENFVRYSKGIMTGSSTITGTSFKSFQKKYLNDMDLTD